MVNGTVQSKMKQRDKGIMLEKNESPFISQMRMHMSRDKSVKMNETAKESHMFLRNFEDIEKSKNIHLTKKARETKNKSKQL